MGASWDLTIGYGLFGALIGVLQWLSLRQQMSGAGWWLLVSSMGWAVGLRVAQAVDDVLGLFVSDEIVGFALLYGVMAAVAGVTSGPILVWLLPPASPRPQAG
jgi:hypothetical protein